MDIRKELSEILILCHLSDDEMVSQGIMDAEVLEDKAVFYRSKCELIHDRISKLYKSI